MRRREFIKLTSGAALAWPAIARAQSAMPVVGFLHTAAASGFIEAIAAFEAGLKAGGFIPGQSIAIEYRWADGQAQRLPELAADLVRRQVAAIATGGGNASIIAAKAASSSIPIIFVTGADPVASGLVASVNRPGGNVTGVSFLVEQVGEKGLSLLQEIVPGARKVGVLINPQSPSVESQRSTVREGAARLGLQPEFVHAATPAELDKAFEALTARGTGALLISADPVFGAYIGQVISLAARHRIPTMYYRREFAAAGGLVSYGTNANEAYRAAGDYVVRVLKGGRPADLPVTQVVKFEFVINLKTAKALGIEVPAGLSARADEIIE